MRVTTTTLRRTAAAVFGGCVVLVLVTLALGVVTVAENVSRPDGADSVASGLMFALVGLVFGMVGALIAVRQPRNTIGWLLLAISACWSFGLASSSYAEYGVLVRPGSVPATALTMAIGNWVWVPAVGLMATFVVLLFPDGHLPSPGWRWLAWVSGAVIGCLSLVMLVDPRGFDETGLQGIRNPLGVDLPSAVHAAGDATFALFPLCMLASAAAGVQRWRRSVGVERQQLKWLAAAAALFTLVFGSVLLLGLVPDVRNNALLTDFVNLVLPLTLCAIPVAIGAAVLRYRLYEIDVVINKAVVLGTLAFFITAVYVGIVVGVGRLVGGGDRPNLALSIAATTVVAVAFQPVRERVQRLANRLVYGVRATPYEVLSEFADRVGGSYDAAELLPTMVRTVAQGLGAERAEVWLAVGPLLVQEATWSRGPAANPDGKAPAHDLTELRGDRVVEVRHQGELLGALLVVKPLGESLNPTEEQLLDDVAAQAGLVLRNVRLIEDLRSSRQRLVTTADEERRRLERNLHDGAQQSLVSVALMISTARARLSPDAALGPALEQAADQLRAAIEELRELARGIHPAILTERGLGPAISALAERSPVPVVVEHRLDHRRPAAVEATVYFLVAEALTNIAKYAHATEAVVTVTSSDGSLTVQIVDDGIGGADETKGSGLRGLADRVAVVDGSLTIDSPPGRGTRLTCTIPERSAADDGRSSSPIAVLEAAR